MNKAMLSQDYHDAGANRVVSVLEELRSGLLNKIDQELVVRPYLSGELCAVTDGRISGYRTMIDDIAWLIQREQRNGR